MTEQPEKLNRPMTKMLPTWCAVCCLAFAADVVADPISEEARAYSTVTYQEDTSIFPNPERGWRHQARPANTDRPPEIIREPHPPLTVEQLTAWRNSEFAYTVFKDDIKIQQWTSDIPQSRLEEIQADFDAVREAGLKTMPRIVYNWGIHNDLDPAEEQIMRHLDQLAPIIAENTDVIMAWEFGIFGSCGEAVRSPQYLSNENNGRQSLKPNAIRIYRRLAEIVPRDRMLLIKLPGFKYDMLDWNSGDEYPESAEPLTPETAYTGSLQARIGFYNDNFAGNANHWGFFYAWPEQDKRFIEQDMRYGLMSGELSGSTEYNRTYGERELKKYHFTCYQPTGGGYREVLDAWRRTGQFDRIARNLGYRFRLLEAQLPDHVALRDNRTLKATLTMANDGYARLVNARCVEIVLRDRASGATHVVSIDGDGKGNRLWLPGPGETKPLKITAPLPPKIASGSYELLLNLADPYPSLHDRPDYSIRLANRGLWEAETGYNKLNHILEID